LRCTRTLREVRADLLPIDTTIGRLQDIIGSRVKCAWVLRRERDWSHTSGPILRTPHQYMDDLSCKAIEAQHTAVPAADVDKIGIERIRCNERELESSGRLPITICDLAIVTPARNRRGTAILLRSVDIVRKLVVGGDVIELPGWLVVPGAPALAAVDTDNRAL